jgi:hypothetical protein
MFKLKEMAGTLNRHNLLIKAVNIKKIEAVLYSPIKILI